MILFEILGVPGAVVGGVGVKNGGGVSLPFWRW